MTTIASQITSLTVVYTTVYWDADQRRHQSSASLAFVWGIHRDRWIPRTNGQLRGKCFHLMTSSWNPYDMEELSHYWSFVRGIHWPPDSGHKESILDILHFLFVIEQTVEQKVELQLIIEAAICIEYSIDAPKPIIEMRWAVGREFSTWSMFNRLFAILWYIGMGCNDSIIFHCPVMPDYTGLSPLGSDAKAFAFLC